MTTSVNQRLGGFSDGVAVIAQSAVPVCLAPNGTVATNGTIALGTALPTTYSVGIWLRLPAGAVVGGSAGLYWAVMSSTTAGQVYTTFIDPSNEFVPYIPSNVVAAVGSNSAYTQATNADVTLVNVTLPGGAMGLYGGVEVDQQWSHPNNANTKTERVALAGSLLGSFFGTTSVHETRNIRARNKGVENRQISTGPVGYGQSTTSPIYISVDTSITTSITLIGQIAVATDYVIIEACTVKVMPS